jgi:hypothetical protein
MSTNRSLVLVILLITGCSRSLDSKQVVSVFGDSAALEVVQAPDRVEAWRVKPPDPELNLELYAHLTRLSETVEVPPHLAKKLARILDSKSTYWWDAARPCYFDPGVQVRFVKGDRFVDVLFCFECKQLGVWYNKEAVGGGLFDYAAASFAAIMKQIFPGDKVIQAL